MYSILIKPMRQSQELVRLREEHQGHEQRFTANNAYSLFNPAYLFMIQQRKIAVLRALRKSGITKLIDARILEMACGSGRVLIDFLAAGAGQRKIIGIDFLQ